MSEKEEIAKDITVAWINSYASSGAIPSPEKVKQMYLTMYDAVNRSKSSESYKAFPPQDLLKD